MLPLAIVSKLSKFNNSTTTSISIADEGCIKVNSLCVINSVLYTPSTFLHASGIAARHATKRQRCWTIDRTGKWTLQ